MVAWYWVVIALYVGAMIGVGLMCILHASSEADRDKGEIYVAKNIKTDLGSNH